MTQQLTTTVHLYDLAPEFRRLMDLLMDPETEPADVAALGAELEQIDMALQAKAEGVAAIKREFEASSKAIAEEISRLSDRKRALDARADRLGKYLFDSVKASGLVRIDGTRFTLSIQKNPSALEVVEQGLIPSKFVETRYEQIVKKDEIKAALKEGQEVPGVRLTQGERLVIK